MPRLGAGLSIKSLKKLVKDIESYKQGLLAKCEEFVNALADLGIDTAQANTGGYGKYITFTKTTDPAVDGCVAVMTATNTGIIRSEWLTKDGIRTADVSPLLMVEFGSGPKALNPLNIEGVGRGTFPKGTHGFDDGWWYMDLNGMWHYSSGVTPKQPMYTALVTMQDQIVAKAREAFGDVGR